MAANRYTSMLPPPPAQDNREVVLAFREFAEALTQYPGQNMDVEVTVSVHPEDGPDNAAEIQMSVYVPKTEYVNILLIGRCQGTEGYPVTVDPYFAGDSFPGGKETCRDRTQLDAFLQQFAQSPEIKSLLDYMQRYAQKK